MNNSLLKLASGVLLFGLICNPLLAAELSDTEKAELKEQLEQQRKQLATSRKQMEAAARSMETASRKLAETRRKLKLEQRRMHKSAFASTDNEFIQFPSTEFEYSASGDGYIGIVINQDSKDGKLKIIGLTPDGPAIQAGLIKGDEILSIENTDLLVLPESDRLQVLLDSLGKTSPNVPISLTVLRGEKPVTVSLTTKERKPGSLHVLLRPPSPAYPSSPPHPLSQLDQQGSTISADTVIKHITVLDDEGGANKLLMRLKTEGGAVSGLNPEAMAALEIHISRLENKIGDMDLNFNMSEFPGGIDMEDFEVIVSTAKDNAFAWFDRSMLKGLEMSSLNPELGTFFKADTGVLILQAEADNALNLKTGDVIIAVDGQMVTRPAAIMRKIRFLEDGASIDLEVIRDGQAETIRSQPVDKSSQGFLYQNNQDSPWLAAKLQKLIN